MPNLDRRISRLPNYLRRFGPARGLAMLWRIEQAWPAVSDRFDDLAVPGLEHAIRLRRNRADRATFWQCIVQNQYRFHDFPQAAQLLQTYERSLESGTQPLIIDCGANIGLSAVWFANALPRARIVAIEPNAENFEILKHNVAPYGDRIEVVRGGVWSHAGHVRITNPDAGSASFRVQPCPPDAAGAIETHTIDAILKAHGCDSPLIVKIDIEGAQGELFSQETAWVGKTSLIVMELDDWQLPWQGTSRSFFSSVSQWPFDYLLGGESIFCFRDFQATRHR